MKIIDLTHSITNDMTVYIGGPQPQNKVIKTVSENGYKETEIHILSHNGTHMDSPNHVFEDGVSLDKIDVINYALDCCHITERTRTAMIGDRRHDADGARLAGIACIGVLYGYGDRTELGNAGVHYMASSVNELKKILCPDAEQV